MLILALIVLIALTAIGTVRHLTAPAVESHMVARAAYRQNLIDNA